PVGRHDSSVRARRRPIGPPHFHLTIVEIGRTWLIGSGLKAATQFSINRRNLSGRGRCSWFGGLRTCASFAFRFVRKPLRPEAAANSGPTGTPRHFVSYASPSHMQQRWRTV